MVELPGPESPSPPFGRTRHPFVMHEMIRRQSVAARGTFREVTERLSATPLPPVDRLLFVGQGTSFHAALAAACATEPAMRGGSQVDACTSFDVLDDPARVVPGTTAVVFSASGETSLTIQAQKALRSVGVTVLLITAREAGTSSTAADRVLPTQYADEESWTHTVSFTSALVAWGAVLDHWSKAPMDLEQAEAEVVESFTTALATEPRMIDEVDGLAERDRVLMVGSGSAEASAREAALKLREAAGRFCGTVGVEELLHGVLPSIGERTAVYAVTSTPLQRTRALQGLAAARVLGARTLLVDSSGGPVEEGIVTLPHGGRLLPPVLQVVPFQLLAYWTAVSEGRNPDVMGLDEARQMAARRTFGI
jgi:glucosamine--fructose-6-phosphate aminotransferase (isomerizing)